VVQTSPVARLAWRTAASLRVSHDAVAAFHKKPHSDNAWIHGGFFLLLPKVVGHIAGGDTLWEMERLASEREPHFRRCYMLAAGNRWIPSAQLEAVAWSMR
jgi:hypothetical protein